MGYYFFDPTYLLIIIGMILSGLASAYVRSTYSRYSGQANSRGMTGAQAAEMLLHSSGIYDVSIQHISGNLTDHYDPKSRVLRLSDTVYASKSVAAIGVAAHECGHAVQHNCNYLPLSIRSAIVPAANFGSQLSWPLILIGFLIRGNAGSLLITGGILLFCLAVLFQVVTLPVELNASNRAVQMLDQNHILSGEETGMVRKVLNAAALTYVAALAASLLQLLRLIIIARGRNRDN